MPGTSVAIVARVHGVNANQVFAWRKLYQAGLLGSANGAAVNEASTRCVRLLPVTVATEVKRGHRQTAVSQRRDGEGEAAKSPGVIELTLAKAQIRITGKVEAAVLRVLLEGLRG